MVKKKHNAEASMSVVFSFNGQGLGGAMTLFCNWLDANYRLFWLRAINSIQDIYLSNLQYVVILTK